MKPISFQNIRRLMGGGRKKNEKDTSFKRSDSFKRISIRKNYLDRGGKSKVKNEINNMRLFQEECKLEEYNIMPINKLKNEKDKVENIYMKGPEVSASKQPDERDKLDNFSERSSVVKVSSEARQAQLQRFTLSRDVCTQTDEVTVPSDQKADNSDRKDPLISDIEPQNGKKSVLEKIIIHVPALEDMPKDSLDENMKPPAHAASLTNCNSDRKQCETNLKRQESNDSAVEMFPWGESVEILKLDRSPVFPYRRNFSHPPMSLMPDIGHESARSDDMCSLSVSLGRIWMDAPLAMSPRSLELPQRTQSTSPSTGARTAHNSLDSALKSTNKDDPIVVNRLQKNKPRNVNTATTSSSVETKTASSINDYPYMFSSKDSGFSFSASITKLNESTAKSASGFFKMKKSTKPKLSVAKDEYLRRSTCIMDSKFNPVFRTSSRSYKEFRNSIKMRKRTKKDTANDIYTVVVRRPPRSATAHRLDPMMFVPPEKDITSIRELKEYSIPVDERISYNDTDSDNDFYEKISMHRKDFDFYETVLPLDYVSSSCNDSILSADTTNSGMHKFTNVYIKNKTGRKPHFSGRRRKNSLAYRTNVIYLKNSDFFDDELSSYVDVDDDFSSLLHDQCVHYFDNDVLPKGIFEETKKKEGRARQVVKRRRSRARRFVSQTKYGDITQKGYEKKRARLLNPHAQKLQVGGAAAGTPAPVGGAGGGGSRPAPPRARRAQRRVTHNEKRYHSENKSSRSGTSSPSQRTAQRCRGNRRLTRNESRYHSEVRQEAVQQALAAMQTRPKPSMPMPSKRTSVMAKSPDRECRDSASSSDEDSTGGGGIESTTGAIGITPLPRSTNRPPPPPPVSSSGSRHHHQHQNQDISQLVDVMSNLTPFSSGPDVTHTAANNRRNNAADRVQRFTYQQSEGNNTGTGRWKVSAKIQQLLNTLKRPKRRPLPEFYEDDDIELEIAANFKDPNAPKPEGSVMNATHGEQLVVPSGLPRNLEAAIQRYGSASFKASVATVLDPNGKTNTLTYGKLLSRSQKISYALLNKAFSKNNEVVLKSGDRIALIYPNNDPINFLCAWYGCLQAGIVPVPIEVPLTRRDAGSQQIGFLLGSCGIQIALTSEACLKGLPKSPTGDVITFKGWPRLHWMVTEHLPRAPKDWLPPPRLSDDTPAYIEYTTDKDGSVMGVTVTRASMFAHCRALTMACSYTEGENMVCVLDFKREVGLWHSILTSVLNGMHVIFIPYALMKVNPASWMQMITKYRASVAIVKSRDLHWGLLATKDHKEISLSSIRLLLVADGANPWSLSSCDQFLSVFQVKGLRCDAVCPCACGSEAMTVSVRRPGRAGGSTGRGVLSMAGLSHGVVRVDQENSLTSLTLQDCGQVMPGSAIIVVKMDGLPYICKTDEVGEICVSGVGGNGYWGLPGLTSSVFSVYPLDPDGKAITDQCYTRSGLLGFLGPGGLVFVCGSRDGLMTVSGRKHNMDDIIATVLAVEPMKFIYRGRIAVFSIKVLRDERICVIAEQRPDCSEEESFQWMSRVLQAVDSIHQVGIYCLALVQHNHLPKTPLGGIHLSECKRRFLEGTLHPANVLLCPHTCVTNLPQPREVHSDVGPASVIVGNLVQGNRLASAQGRDMGQTDDSDAARKYQFISEILRWRAMSTPDHNLFTLLNSKGGVAKMLSCSELHKKAERIGNLLLEKGRINTGDHVALIFPPGLDLICAFYGCLYVGAVPVTIRPPHLQNLQTTLPTVRMIVDVSKSVLVMSNQNVIKLLKSKEASNAVDIKSWPMILDTDDMPKKKLNILYRAPTAEMLAYLDFSVSTTGMLAGIKMSHAAVTSLCRSMKLACELYPSRHIALCLDPYCGLGFALWCLSSIYSGHHSILIPPSEVEVNAALWLTAVSHYRVRDTFCSYGVMELCTKGLGSTVNHLKSRGVNLGCVRTCVAIAEERPRINLTSSFSKLFSALGLSPRAVSTSFGCRVNIAICLQGASSPEPSTVYVDLRALRNDRVSLVERGSPHSLCLMESGKLLPGVKVIIANPETKGQCGDSHLGEIWVQSPHNASGYFTIYGEESEYVDHFNAELVTGKTGEVYARTGYLGFLRRTEGTLRTGNEDNNISIPNRDTDDNVEMSGFQGGSDSSEMQDAVFVVGALDETIVMRGMRYHPIDIENSVMRCHKKIAECAVFTWSNLLVVVAELDGNDSEALNLVPLITNAVLEEHQLVVGVVVVVDPGVVPINSRGEKQRMHLRDGFLSDQIDAIYIAYNM